MKKDADELLTEWGIWVWQGAGVPRCTSPMYALMRDNVEQHSDPLANITDDDALMIDAMIASMKRLYPEMGNCVDTYYRHRETMQETGKRLNMSRLKVREKLIAGRAYIDALLDQRIAA